MKPSPAPLEKRNKPLKIAGMTIVQTMTLIALFGLTMHLEFYWIAGVVAAIFLFGIWAGRRATRHGDSTP